MSAAAPDRVQAALEELDYPAGKDAIVQHATRQRAEEGVMRLLRALPVAIYDNRAQVMASVPFDQGVVGENQTTDERMNERRHHTYSGLAEHEKQVPQSPIEEELGYNRGS